MGWTTSLLTTLLKPAGVEAVELCTQKGKLTGPRTKDDQGTRSPEACDAPSHAYLIGQFEPANQHIAPAGRREAGGRCVILLLIGRRYHHCIH